MKQLTPRQREILKYKARGMTAKDIAKILHVSPRTVETHLSYARTRSDKSTSELIVLVATNSA